MSRLRSPALPMVGGWSRSRAPASLPIIRPGATPLSASRNVDASSSQRAIEGRVYARHGTTVETRLTVIDRMPASDPEVFPASPGMAPDAATLLSWVLQHVPARLPVDGASLVQEAASVIPVRTKPASAPRPTSSVATAFEPVGTELAYETVDWKPAEDGRLTEALYEPYGLQSIRIEGARPHPTRLVQSAAMASVAPPKPTYRPRLPVQRRHRWPAVRCPARERHLCRRGPPRPSRRIVGGGRDLRCRLGGTR